MLKLEELIDNQIKDWSLDQKFYKDDEIFIAEMGTNKKGEIAYLSDIVKPDMSLITNISEAHIGNFDSIEEIYIEKKNIFDSLDNDGIAFINIDDKFISNTNLIM